MRQVSHPFAPWVHTSRVSNSSRAMFSPILTSRRPRGRSGCVRGAQSLRPGDRAPHPVWILASILRWNLELNHAPNLGPNLEQNLDPNRQSPRHGLLRLLRSQKPSRTLRACSTRARPHATRDWPPSKKVMIPGDEQHNLCTI